VGWRAAVSRQGPGPARGRGRRGRRRATRPTPRSLGAPPVPPPPPRPPIRILRTVPPLILSPASPPTRMLPRGSSLPASLFAAVREPITFWMLRTPPVAVAPPNKGKFKNLGSWTETKFG